MKRECGCPATEDLSALIDDELGPPLASQIRLHALACPTCGARIRQFGALRSDLQQLRHQTIDTDLAAIVLARLGGLPESAIRKKQWRRLAWPRLRDVAPKAMGGAAALGAGISLGLALLAGSGTAVRPAGMSAFDAEGATTLCAGLPSCGPRGR